MNTILVSIGNSDGKLDQRTWSNYVRLVHSIFIECRAVHIHGEWFSASAAPFQNAGWCFQIEDRHAYMNPADVRADIRKKLAEAARLYQQDSIAWLEGETEFIKTEAKK